MGIGCLFLHSEIRFDTLNGFDESFFAHMEEIDLCWRAFNRNLKTVYIGTSTVFHVGGATLKNTNPKKTYLNFRNSLFALTKNASGNLFILIFTRLLLDGIASAMFLITFKFQHIIAVLKAHISFYKHLPLLLKKRKNLKQKTHYFNTKSIVWDYYIKRKHQV